MKKFKFSMDRLLFYKDRVLSSEKIEMGNLISKKNELFDELTEAQKNLNNMIFELNLKISEGTTVFEINKITFQIDSYKQYIESINKEISIIDENIDLQRQVLISASKDVSILETLKDNKLREYNKKKSDVESKLIEDMLVQKKFYLSN